MAGRTTRSASVHSLSSDSVPDSSRSRSSVSPMRRTRRSAFWVAICTIRSPCGESGPSLPDASSPSDPRMEVSGVRSSWLTTDTSSSLMRSTSPRRRMSSRSWISVTTLAARSVSTRTSRSVQRRGVKSPTHSVPSACPPATVSGMPRYACSFHSVRKALREKRGSAAASSTTIGSPEVTAHLQ